MTMKCKVMLARFPGNFHEDPDTVSWMMKTLREMYEDPRIGPENVHCFCKSDTPIDMVRNQCIQNALDLGIDYLLMIDNDMKPDYQRPGKLLRPFWKTAFDWIYRRDAPAAIAAPYVGPNPINNIYIFRWRNWNNYNPLAYNLDQFTREEAAERTGIEKVAALPTGLVLMDMRLYEPGKMVLPWFDYEREGDEGSCPACSQPKRGKWLGKASTEDVYWSRNLANAWRHTPGSGVYCLWDSWCIHIKRSYCLPPELPHVDQMGVIMDEALQINRRTDEVLMHIGGADCPYDDQSVHDLSGRIPIIDLTSDDPYGERGPRDHDLLPTNGEQVAVGNPLANSPDTRMITVNCNEFAEKVERAFPEIRRTDDDDTI